MHFVAVKDEGYCELNPVQFGYEDCEKSHLYGPATRYHWLIHYVVSGCGRFVRGEKEYSVSSGEMFVIRPWEVTFYQADNENPWSYIWIGFTSERELPVELDDVISCPGAIDIFNSMKKCEEKTGGRSMWLCGKLWELFSMLQDGEIRKRDYVQEAIEMIRSEFAGPITIEQIAAKLNLDRTYFSSLFKKKTGVSPKQYLLDFRMNRARWFLAEKGESVAVTACSVGYGDVYNFSKMFKKHFGMSPREYVKRM